MKMSFKLKEWDNDIPFFPALAACSQSNWTITTVSSSFCEHITRECLKMRTCNAFLPLKFSIFFLSRRKLFLNRIRARMGHRPFILILMCVCVCRTVAARTTHYITPIGFSFRLSKLQQALFIIELYVTKWIFDSTEYQLEPNIFHSPYTVDALSKTTFECLFYFIFWCEAQTFEFEKNTPFYSLIPEAIINWT